MDILSHLFKRCHRNTITAYTQSASPGVNLMLNSWKEWCKVFHSIVWQDKAEFPPMATSFLCFWNMTRHKTCNGMLPCYPLQDKSVKWIYFQQIFSVIDLKKIFEKNVEQRNKQQPCQSEYYLKIFFLEICILPKALKSDLRSKLQYFQWFLFSKSVTVHCHYSLEELLLVPQSERLWTI